MKPQRLDDLCDLWRDGRLNEDQRRELNALLRDSAEARTRFREQARFHGLLHAAVAAASVDMAVDAMGSARSVRPSWSLRLVVGWIRPGQWAMAACLLVAVGASLVAWQVSLRTPEVGVEIAHLGDLSGVRLSYRKGRVPVDVVPGKAIRVADYQLENGTMEMRYASGVAVIIQAPAQFDLVSDSLIRLHLGRLSAKVPHEAIGFTVKTPTADVVDLGTEFGVSTDDNDSEVHVFEGKVMVKTALEPDPLLITERRASRIDLATGTPTGVDFQPNAFLRNLRESNDEVVEAVRALAPISFYRMTASADGTMLMDDRTDGHPGQILGIAGHQPLASGFKGGTALNMSGAEGRVYARVLDFPKSTNGQLSVCAWVYANRRPRWGSIVKNWAKEGAINLGGQFHFGIFKDDGDLEVHVHDAAGAEIGVREVTPLPLGAWHFVAFTMDGNVLRLYRNGVQVAEKPCQGLWQQGPEVLGIGVKLGFDRILPDTRNAGLWDGRIDNVAIFHRALSSQEMVSLHHAAQVPER